MLARSAAYKITDCLQELRTNSYTVMRKVTMGSPLVCWLSVTVPFAWTFSGRGVGMCLSYEGTRGSPGKTSMSTVSRRKSSGTLCPGENALALVKATAARNHLQLDRSANHEYGLRARIKSKERRHNSKVRRQNSKVIDCNGHRGKLT